MIRDLLSVLTAAASAVLVGAVVIFAVTIGALFLPQGNGPGAVLAVGAWALLTVAILGVGALAVLSLVFSGKAAPRRAVVRASPILWRPFRRCPVCRTGGVRQGLVWCARCLTPHHEDCWRYAGKCAVFACGGDVSSIAR